MEYVDTEIVLKSIHIYSYLCW